MGKKSAATVRVEESIAVETSNVDVPVVQAEAPAVPVEDKTNPEASQATQNQHQQRRVYLQNRRCGVYMFENLLPDGKTIRITQVLDSPVDFTNHPNFVSGMNKFRNDCFGENARLYETKNVDIPEENPEFIVHFAFIHTKTGAISGEKVFTKAEARTSLKKMREDIQRWREQRRAYYHSRTPNEFGTEMSAAIRDAREQQESASKIASN